MFDPTTKPLKFYDSFISRCHGFTPLLSPRKINPPSYAGSADVLRHNTIQVFRTLMFACLLLQGNSCSPVSHLQTKTPSAETMTTSSPLSSMNFDFDFGNMSFSSLFKKASNLLGIGSPSKPPPLDGEVTFVVQSFAIAFLLKGRIIKKQWPSTSHCAPVCRSFIARTTCACIPLLYWDQRRSTTLDTWTYDPKMTR